MSLRVFLVFGLCAFVVAVGGGATAASLAAPAPPRLRPAPGWTSIRSLLISVSPRRSEPAASQASVIAATAADAARLSPFALVASLTRLRRGGIVVMATTIGRHRPSFHFARARFPLRLSSLRVDHGWETSPPRTFSSGLVRSPSVAGTSTCASTSPPSTPIASSWRRRKPNSVGCASRRPERGACRFHARLSAVGAVWRRRSRSGSVPPARSA